MKRGSGRLLIPGRFTRRDLLRASGAGAALAPFLPAQMAEAAGPKRFVVWWTPNGIFEPEYAPTGSGKSFAFKRILAPLQRHRDKLLILKDLDMQVFFQFPIPNNHGEPLSQTLCAARTVGGNSFLGGGPSIDQFIAQKLARGGSFDGLNICAGAYSPHARISYRASGDAITAQENPQSVFDSLFKQTVQISDTSADQLRAQRRSTIDLVRSELNQLKTKIGADDRRKLDAHLEHLRALEIRLAPPVGGVTLGACAAPDLAQQSNPSTFVSDGRKQVANMFTALRCDLSRVATFIWGGPTSGEVYSWAGATGRHHDLSHAYKPAPGSSEYEQLTNIGRWQAEEFGRFLDLLQSVPEGTGSMLDNSIVLWISEHRAEVGAHDRRNIPCLIAGSGGGALQTGQLLRLGGRSHGDLFVNICHAMGFSEVTTFGEPSLCKGPLPGVSV